MPLPISSNPNLLAILDSVAFVICATPDTAPVTFGPGITPAQHWWEIFDWQHADHPTRWSTWIAAIDQGQWPLSEYVTQADKAELDVAVACFVGEKVCSLYSELKSALPVRTVGVKNHLDTSSESAIMRAHGAMLKQLNDTDRNFFAMVDTLGEPWYLHWTNRASADLTKSTPVSFPESDGHIEF